MRRNPIEEGRRWLEQADADRYGAQLLLDGASYHLACFIGQQVAEKALKAFLYAQGEENVIGRSVEALCRRAAEYDADFDALHEIVAPLDGYYIATRYPNGLPDSIPARVYTRSVAEEVLNLCDQALNLVHRKLDPPSKHAP
jgi:HEPN domain-containing protein